MTRHPPLWLQRPSFHSLPPTLCPSYFYLLHGPVPVLPPSLLLPYSPYLSSNHDYYYYTSSPTTSTTNAFSSSLRPSTPLPQLQHRNPISYSSSSSPWTTSISPPRHPHLWQVGLLPAPIVLSIVIVSSEDRKRKNETREYMWICFDMFQSYLVNMICPNPSFLT